MRAEIELGKVANPATLLNDVEFMTQQFNNCSPRSARSRTSSSPAGTGSRRHGLRPNGGPERESMCHRQIGLARRCGDGKVSELLL